METQPHPPPHVSKGVGPSRGPPSGTFPQTCGCCTEGECEWCFSFGIDFWSSVVKKFKVRRARCSCAGGDFLAIPPFVLKVDF